jgi:hypothetical protein
MVQLRNERAEPIGLRFGVDRAEIRFRLRIPGREQGHVVATRHEPLDQEEDDPLDPAVPVGRNRKPNGSKERDLHDSCQLWPMRPQRTSAGERTRTSRGLAAQRDLNPPRLPVPPRPHADGSRIEALGNAHAVTTRENREEESRESDETKYDEAVEHESEERERLGERLADELPPSDED